MSIYSIKQLFLSLQVLSPAQKNKKFEEIFEHWLDHLDYFLYIYFFQKSFFVVSFIVRA